MMGADGCEQRGCDVPRLGERHCVEHVDDAELRSAVKLWPLGGRLDMRNATITGGRLDRLLDALADLDLDPRSGEATRLRPRGCGTIHFEGARFVDEADFSDLSFLGPVLFDGAVFVGPADFSRTSFGEHADFDHVAFCDRVSFERTIFSDHAGFQGARFEQAALFGAAKFRSYADFEDAWFGQDANLIGATFQLARQLGPLNISGKLWLDESVFDERVTIEVVASELSARTTVFANGARLSVAGADVDLERADFGRASTLACHEPDGPKPRLTALRGAQVASLSISGCDLSACRFIGAHGLESLNFEQSCEWPHAPESWRCIDRQVIAEEIDWRLASERGQRHRTMPERIAPRWSDPAAGREDGDRTAGAPLDPAQLAGLYRALRKSREDSKDQAGAGDLYYGEMEMRRRTPLPEGRGRLRGRADRAIIGGYWLLAGYGLRASRAVFALAATVAVAAIPLAATASKPDMSYAKAALFAAQSSVALVHPPETHLSAYGEVVQLAVRISGPALLGLAVLSLRSRIKR